MVLYYLTMAKVILEGFGCERCKHEWVPRKREDPPRVCPRCKSPYWDLPRRDQAEPLVEQRPKGKARA